HHDVLLGQPRRLRDVAEDLGLRERLAARLLRHRLVSQWKGFGVPRRPATAQDRHQVPESEGD
ncbi:MAG: hypothetical protein ACK56I_10710, partial [bacterium]